MNTPPPKAFVVRIPDSSGSRKETPGDRPLRGLVRTEAVLPALKGLADLNAMRGARKGGTDCAAGRSRCELSRTSRWGLPSPAIRLARWVCGWGRRSYARRTDGAGRGRSCQGSRNRWLGLVANAVRFASATRGIGWPIEAPQLRRMRERAVQSRHRSPAEALLGGRAPRRFVYV